MTEEFYPSDWLNNKIDKWDKNELRAALLFILGTLSEDDVQDIFQSEMEKDGFFDKGGV